MDSPVYNFYTLDESAPFNRAWAVNVEQPKNNTNKNGEVKKKFFRLGATGKIIICFMYNPNSQLYSRGISICSPEDLYNETDGRNKAEGRARQALCNECSDDEGVVCRKEAIDILRREGVYPFLAGVYRGEFVPILLPIEKAILRRWKNQK